MKDITFKVEHVRITIKASNDITLSDSERTDFPIYFRPEMLSSLILGLQNAKSIYEENFIENDD